MDFVEYAEVHDEPSTTNIMKSFTRNCLGILPTGNLQGTYKFLYLTTVKKLNKRAWTPIPIPDAIIKRVEYLADLNCRSGSSGGYIFGNCNHDRYSDGNEGDDEEPLIDQ